jgi:hypothetical protein
MKRSLSRQWRSGCCRLLTLAESLPMGSRDSFLVASASISADVFSAMPSKPVAKKPIPGKTQAIKPAQKNVAQKKRAPDKLKDLRLLKETLKSSPVQKKPDPDKVENLAIEYLAELKEADVTFEKGTAVLEKYRAKYPELASYIREIASGERRIEIRQRLEGEDINLHLFAIRVLEDEARYEVKLSGDTEHRTVKSPEWLSLLQNKLARIVAKILYARETSKSEKQDLDISGPTA